MARGEYARSMQRTRVCPGCEDRLTHASNAMRRHLSDMHSALDLARSESITDEQRQLFAASLSETLAEAQVAWDGYVKHLAEHGLVPGEKCEPLVNVR